MAAYLDAAMASALRKAGKDENFCLKADPRAIIKAVVCSKRDVLGVLPTGFGKSLVFHLLSDVFDFVEAKGPPTQTKAITIVVSPLNALLRYQIGKLDNLGAIILNGTKGTNHLAIETVRATCCNGHLYLCKIENIDFLKICQEEGFY